MGKRLVSTIGVLSFFIYTAAAQEQVMTIEDLFQLADQNSKSIQLHSLAIDETTQAVEVAKNAKLPSIRAQVDLNYIGDGCMTDRDFSNGIHADTPEEVSMPTSKKRNCNSNWHNRLIKTTSRICASCYWGIILICFS